MQKMVQMNEEHNCVYCNAHLNINNAHIFTFGNKDSVLSGYCISCHLKLIERHNNGEIIYWINRDKVKNNTKVVYIQNPFFPGLKSWVIKDE